MEEDLYKVGLYTLGCKVSSYETEAVAETFEREGFLVCPFDAVCDVYVINTCTVTAESDAKSRKYIRRAIRKNPSALVLVMGCYSQRSPSEVAAIEGVSAVIGTKDKLSLVGVAKELLSKRTKSSSDTQINSTGANSTEEKKCGYVSVSSLEGAEFEKMSITKAPRTRGYVKIEDGCDCKCTYCAISAARGPVRSKPQSDVLSEVRALYQSGTREIVLTGIETGSYGKDLGCGCSLSDLLIMLDSEGACERIRIGSMAPELIGEDFARRACTLGILVPHFHVSMQSGSNNVLRAMKRRYTREMALRNMARIKEYMPDVMFTADLMVGFPGETDEDFEDTVCFVREAELLDAHVFAYSAREGTLAAHMPDQIPDEVKKERSARLISVKNEVRSEVLSHLVENKKIMQTVIETKDADTYTGHSDSYVEVSVKSDRDIRGDIVGVMPVSHKNGVICGEIIT